MCVTEASDQLALYRRRLSTAAEAFSAGVTLLSYRSNRAFDQPLLQQLPPSSASSNPSRRDSTSAVTLTMAAAAAAALPLRQLSTALTAAHDRQSADAEHLLDMVARAQESRLNEQRCELPKHLQVEDWLPLDCTESSSSYRNAGRPHPPMLQPWQRHRPIAVRTRSAPLSLVLSQHQPPRRRQTLSKCAFQASGDQMPLVGPVRRSTTAQQPLPQSSVPSPQPPTSSDVERVRSLLGNPGPYPMVVLPSTGGYWADGFIEDGSGHHKLPAKKGFLSQFTRRDVENDIADADDLEADDAVNHYREGFAGQEHLNYYANDDVCGPVVLSLKKCPLATAGHEVAQAILRTRSRTVRCTLALDGSDGYHEPSVASLAKACCEEITTSRFYPVSFLGASKLLSEYDDRFVTRQFKFGIIYQRFGQIAEEDLFGNRGTSAAFEEFLNLLGDRVTLQGFEGFRGGLDTQLGQTGRESVYTRHHDRELMFHVSTFLPYADGDSQQVQRKRHIGNDIVAIIFQEANTPFIPNSITSQFLHAYIIVQPVVSEDGETLYKVSVTARSDVPRFGPKLKHPAVYSSDENFRNFILTKLLNAEHACQKAPQFSYKMERTRLAYLTDLQSELFQKNAEAMLAHEQHQEKSAGFLGSIKKLALRKGSANEPVTRKTEFQYPSKEQKGIKKTSAPCMSSNSSANGNAATASVNNLLRSGTSWDERLASAAFGLSRQATSLQSIATDVPAGRNASAGTPLLAAGRSTSLLKLPGASTSSTAGMECSACDYGASSSASSSPRIPRFVTSSNAPEDVKWSTSCWCNSPSSTYSFGAGSADCEDCFHNCYDSDAGIASLSPTVTPCSTLELARRECPLAVGSAEKQPSLPARVDSADLTHLKKEMSDLRQTVSVLQSENSALKKELREYSDSGCYSCPRGATYRNLSSSYVPSSDTAQDDSVSSKAEDAIANLRNSAASPSHDLKKLYALAGTEAAIV